MAIRSAVRASLLALLFIAACTGAPASPATSELADLPSTGEPITAAPSRTPSSPAAEFVGEWERDQTCAEIVAVYGDEGLDEFAAESL